MRGDLSRSIGISVCEASKREYGVIWRLWAGRLPSRRRRLPQITGPTDRIKIIQFQSRIPVADGGGNNGNPVEPITALPLRAARATAGLRTRRPPHLRIRHPLRQQRKVHRSSGRRTHTTVRSTAGNGGTAGRTNHLIRQAPIRNRVNRATVRLQRAPTTFSHSAERR